MEFSFQTATVKGTKARIGISGGAGSGKTYTALKIAQGLCPKGKIFLLDTEHHSASKYAKRFKFQTNAVDFPNYSPDTYVAAIKAAERTGADVIIIDSASHEWFGPGGCLDMVDKATGSNKFGNWATVTPKHQRFIETMLGSKAHIIATFRSKTEYIQIAKATGGTEIKKVGMAAITRDGMDYEFDIFLEMDANHVGFVSKTRCEPLTDQRYEKPGDEFAQIITDWLSESDGDAPHIETAPVRSFPNLNKAIIERMEQVRENAIHQGWEPPYPENDVTLEGITDWGKRVPLMLDWINLHRQAQSRGIELPLSYLPDFSMSRDDMAEIIGFVKDALKG
jgi:hypothetical protein